MLAQTGFELLNAKRAALSGPIAKADPHNPSAQRLAAVAQENLCESTARAGAAEEALRHCEAALDLYGGMAAADPKDAQAFEDLASGGSTMSLAPDLAHHLQAALQHQQKARQMYDTAMRRDSDALELAKLRQELHIAGAGTAAAEAVRNLKMLAARSPQSQKIAVSLHAAEELYQSLH